MAGSGGARRGGEQVVGYTDLTHRGCSWEHSTTTTKQLNVHPHKQLQNDISLLRTTIKYENHLIGFETTKQTAHKNHKTLW